MVRSCSSDESEGDDAAAGEVLLLLVEGESRAGVVCFFRSRQGLLSSALTSRRRRFERARADAGAADVGSDSVSTISRSEDSSEGVGRFVPAARGGSGEDDSEGDSDLCILRCSGEGEDGGELSGDDVGWLRWGLGESCWCCCSVTRSRS